MPDLVFGSDLAPGMVIDRMNLFVGETLWLGAFRIDYIGESVATGTRLSDGTRVSLQIAPKAIYWLVDEATPAVAGGQR